MAKEERISVIVTFKPKEQRPDKEKDKLEIFSAEITSDVSFFDAESMSRGVAVPSGMPQEVIGYDVNMYEAPIVMATLTKKEIDALRKNDNVAAVEDDGPCYPLGDYHRNDGFVIEGQPSPQAETIPGGISQIRAPEAWDISRGKGIKVFVLDTGIDGTHPDLAGNYKSGTSFVPSESSPMDFNSHGTHCAGTIGARINGSGVVGVAPAVYLYAVKVLPASGPGQWSWLIAGIDWCISKKGRKILSMSLGGSGAPSAVETICKTAWDRGLLLVAAAGNTGSSVGNPANYDSVTAVSNISSSNVIWGSSSRGPEVELCARGVSVLSTLPGGGYGTKTGTSMACPHVSGAAALAWGAHRFADNVTIRRLLAWTADNLGVPGRDDLYGYGRVDAEQAAFSLWSPPAIPGIP